MIELLCQAIRWQATVNQAAMDLAEWYGMTVAEAVQSIVRPILEGEP